jgi:hypothetical protein
MRKHHVLILLVPVLLVGFWLTFNVMAQSVAEQMAGQILLEVESNGEAWYVHPESMERYYMGRPADALNVMQSLGLGIITEKLEMVPIGLIAQTGSDKDRDGLVDLLEHAIGSDDQVADTDGDGFTDREEVMNGYMPNGAEKYAIDPTLVDQLMGRIMLQVEDHGEAWYVAPEIGKRYFLGRPAHAFQIMQDLGVGITLQDLSEIPIAATSIIPAR